MFLCFSYFALVGRGEGRLIMGLLAALTFVILIPLNHYFLLTPFALIVKNPLLPGWARSFALKDILDARQEGVRIHPGYRGTRLRIMLKDYRISRLQTSALSNKKLSELVAQVRGRMG